MRNTFHTVLNRLLQSIAPDLESLRFDQHDRAVQADLEFGRDEMDGLARIELWRPAARSDHSSPGAAGDS